MKIVKKFRKIFTMEKDLLEAQIDAINAKIYAQEAKADIEIIAKRIEEFEKEFKILRSKYETLCYFLRMHSNLTKSREKEGKGG